MHRLLRSCGLIGLLWLGGCSGEYFLTCPDAAGMAGASAPMVVRLQRREFGPWIVPISDAAITFKLGQTPVKCARTDKQGYAAVSLPLPREPGNYPVQIEHQDIKGDSVAGTANVSSLSPDRPVAAVDLESLPTSAKAAEVAAKALSELQKQVSVVYLSRGQPAQSRQAHQMLAKNDYPLSSVLPCRREWPWYEPAMEVGPGFKPAPRLARLDESMLGLLKRQLPQLRYGITAEADVAKAFQQAGLEVLIVGKAGGKLPNSWHVPSWPALEIPTSLPAE